MLTRQGRRSPEDQDETILRALQAAGIPDLGSMDSEERSNIYQALEISKVGHVKEETQRLSLNSQSSPPHGSAEPQLIQGSSKTSAPGYEDKCGSPSVASDISEQFLDSATELGSSKEQFGLDNVRQVSKTSVVSIDDKTGEENYVRPSKLSLAKPQASKNIGRGRAQPVKTKYPALSINSPGSPKPSSGSCPASSNHPNGPQHCPSSSMSAQSSPSVPDTPSSTQKRPSTPENDHSLKNFVPNESSPQQAASSQGSMSSQSTVLLSPMNQGSPEVPNEATDERGAKSQTSDTEFVDVETASQKSMSQSVSSICDNQPESPASVEDAGEEEDKEPVKTVKIGKFTTTVSPLEAVMKPMAVSQFSLYFKELDKYRDNKMEWMAKAKEMVQEHRLALFDKLLKDNPQWGPPVSDGGYNKQTLFKQSAPKYSKLFASTADKPATIPVVRMERQSKTQAMTKIQEVIQDDWASDQDFHSLRKSHQKNAKVLEQQEGKEQGTVWGSRNRTDVSVEDDEECREDVTLERSSEKWHNNKLEQRGKQADSDSEASPESPNVGGSHDVYKYEDEDIWEVKSKKNSKRGAKSIQGDVAVEGRTSHRGRGAGSGQQSQRGKTTRARVQKGAISRPSEHGTSSRNKAGSSENIDGETNARNNANTDRSWLSTDHTGAEGSDITPNKFYPSKVVQPRSQHSSQPRRCKDNPRLGDFPSSPGSSGSYKQHEARNEAAAVMHECPICGKGFPASEIEAHCSGCDDFKSDAVGQEPPIEIQDSEESDRAVEDVERAESPESSSCESKEASASQSFIRKEVPLQTDHFKEGTSFLSSGSKRANPLGSDDGPVKKATRFIE